VPHASWRWSQGQRLARSGGLQQPMGAAKPGARPVARRGVGEASEARGTAGCGEALAGMPRAMGLYISYTPFCLARGYALPGAPARGSKRLMAPPIPSVNSFIEN